MDPQDEAPQEWALQNWAPQERALHVPFVFVPEGADAPAAWRAAHPEAVRVPARLVWRDGVRRAQFAVRIPMTPPVGVPGPGRDRAGELLRWLKDRWSSILRSEPDDERWIRPPPGSKPINETPWSGDHGEIKEAIGLKGKDDTRISPDGDVWGKNPDGTWTNHGPASGFTGSGQASGRNGRDREQRRNENE